MHDNYVHIFTFVISDVATKSKARTTFRRAISVRLQKEGGGGRDCTCVESRSIHVVHAKGVRSNARRWVSGEIESQGDTCLVSARSQDDPHAHLIYALFARQEDEEEEFATSRMVVDREEVNHVVKKKLVMCVYISCGENTQLKHFLSGNKR